jgi:hypothetical protein
MEAERVQVLLRLIKVANYTVSKHHNKRMQTKRSYQDGEDSVEMDSDCYADGCEELSSNGYDEDDESDSDGFVNRESIGEEDMEISDGIQTFSSHSDLSEPKTRNNPPPTKTSSIQNALEIAAKDPTSNVKAGILKFF